MSGVKEESTYYSLQWGLQNNDWGIFLNRKNFKLFRFIDKTEYITQVVRNLQEYIYSVISSTIIKVSQFLKFQDELR